MAASTESTSDPFFISNSENVFSVPKMSFRGEETSFPSFNNKKFGNGRGNAFTSKGDKFRSNFTKPRHGGRTKPNIISGVNAIPLKNAKNFSEKTNSPNEKNGAPRDRFFIKSPGPFRSKEKQDRPMEFPNQDRKPWKNKPTKNLSHRTVGANLAQLEGKNKHKFFQEETNETDEVNEDVTNTRNSFVKKNKKRKTNAENTRLNLKERNNRHTIDNSMELGNFSSAKGNHSHSDNRNKLKCKNFERNDVLISEFIASSETESISFVKKKKAFKGTTENTIVDKHTMHNGSVDQTFSLKKQRFAGFIKTKGSRKEVNTKNFENNVEEPERMTSFQKAMLEYKNKQTVKEMEKKEQAKTKEEREHALKQYKKKKREKSIKLSKKTRKGQPVMKERMEMLLEKIQKTIAKEEKGG